MHKEQIGGTDNTVQSESGKKEGRLHGACMIIPVVLLTVFSVLVFGLLAAPAMQRYGANVIGYDLLKESASPWRNCVITMLVFAGVGIAVAVVAACFIFTKKGLSSEYVYGVIPVYFAQMVTASILYGICMPLSGAALIALSALALVFSVMSAACTIIDRGVFKRNWRYAISRYLPFNLMILYLFMIFLFIGTSVINLDGVGISGYEFLLFRKAYEGELASFYSCIISLIVFASIGMLLIIIQGYFYSGETTVGQNIVANCIVTNLLYLVEAVISMAMVIRLHSWKIPCGELPLAILSLSLALIVVTTVCSIFTSKKLVKTYALSPEIREVASYSFSHCDKLTEIMIPRTVKVIEGYALWACPALTTVRYDGTREEWSGITKKQNWCANSGEYVVCCSDGKIEK